MKDLSILDLGKLELKLVKIEALYLDPNNPRFMGMESQSITAKNKYTNTKVQQRALNNMENYGIKELKQNIEQVGFLPIDKMVFAQIEDWSNEYYCLEGNRRLAAIKWLLEDYDLGEVEIKPGILKTIKLLHVYILKESKDFKKAQEIIQGIRHMSGVRDWRPYQKAKVINGLISEGKEKQEIAKMFGTNSQTVMRYYRAFLACQDFINNENYGQFWNMELFRMFDDVMKRPRLRNEWLGWDDASKTFNNTTEVEYFYKWIIYDQETRERKIPGANYIKDLDEIVAHPIALEYLKNEGTTLSSALALAKPKHETTWIAVIEEAIKVLKDIEAAELENLSSDCESKLKDLKDEITKTR